MQTVLVELESLARALPPPFIPDPTTSEKIGDVEARLGWLIDDLNSWHRMLVQGGKFEFEIKGETSETERKTSKTEG
jgi:hypothetical protein